jgi:uncharacterized membrane protein
MGPSVHLDPSWVDRPWWDGFGWLMPLLFLAVFAAIAVWAISRVSKQQPLAAAPWGAPPPSPAQPDGAVEQARLRYAKGEITRDEYLQIARDLGGPSEPSGGDRDV